MVNQAGRDFLQLEIGHAVGADHRGAFLAVEGIHDLLQRGLVLVDVVAIELDGEPPAGRMHDRLVPAAADEQVLPFGNDVDHPAVLPREGAKQFGRAVGRVVVHDDQVEGEGGLLLQDGADGVAHGLDPVPHGDDHRGFVLRRLHRPGRGS